MAPGLGAVAGALLCLAARARAYDYEDIVQEYCNTAKDWGPLPPRPAGAGKLLQAQVFVRHGSRVQCEAEACWPGDHEGSFTCGLNYLENSVDGGNAPPLTQDFRTEYLAGRNGLSGNCKTGQLVPDGLQMHVANGQRLREAYVLREHLLPETLQGLGEEGLERTFFLRSTDVARTKQSAMALFSGLYRDHREERPPYLRLHSMDTTEENMWVNMKTCPAARLAAEEFFRTYPGAEAVEGLCRELGKPTDGSAASRHRCLGHLQHQVDCLMSRMCPTVPFHPRNATIPAKFLSEDAALLRRLWRTVDELQFAYFRSIRRLGIGPFVGEVLAAATAAAEGRPEAKPLVLWSGHDDGPMEPLWAAFGLREGPPYWPPFASMMVLELWNSSAGPLARWVSNGAVVAGGAKPWPHLRSQAEALVPGPGECQAVPKGGEEQPQRPHAELPAAVVPALLCAVLALLSAAVWQLRRGRGPWGKLRADSSQSLLAQDVLGA